MDKVALYQSKIMQLEKEVEILTHLYQKALNLSQTDPLTGLKNISSFREILDNECRRSWRDTAPMALVHLALDNFDPLSDLIGIKETDHLYVKISNTLRSHLRRGGDYAARFTSGQFLILLCNTPMQGALTRADIFRMEIKNLKISNPYSRSGILSASCGIACLEANKRIAPERLMTMADAASVRAQKKGGDFSEIYQYHH